MYFGAILTSSLKKFSPLSETILRQIHFKFLANEISFDIKKHHFRILCNVKMMVHTQNKIYVCYMVTATMLTLAWLYYKYGSLT